MKNIILFVLINCFCIGYVNSQDIRPRYAFDNFQTTKGVQVTSRTSSTAASQPENKPFVKKTAQTNNIALAINSKNAASPIVKLVEKTVMSSGKSLGAFSTGDTTIDSYIAESSARYNIDPLLIYAQMHQESGFKRRATSYKGASGLMQLMPATAMRFGVTNIYDPKQNIDAGVKYMRWLLNKFDGNVNLALAGYNAGEGAVMKYGNQIPPYQETQGYVKRISSHYNSIRKTNSPRNVTKPAPQTLAQLEKQLPAAAAAAAPKFERNSSTVRLANGKKSLSNL